MVANCGLSVLGDGICIMDILKGTVHPVGIASLNELYDAAYWIIHECVMGDEVGGRAVNIGKEFGTDCLTFRLSSVFFPSAEMALSYYLSVQGCRLELCIMGREHGLPMTSIASLYRRYRFHHCSRGNLQKPALSFQHPCFYLRRSGMRM